MTKYKYLLLIVSFLIGNFFSSLTTTHAGSIVNTTNTMSRLKVSTASNHTITFNKDALTSWSSGETLTISLDAGFNLGSLSSSAPLDYDIRVGSTDEVVVANGACLTTDAIEITSITGQVITLTACPNYTAGANGAQITIKIGSHTTIGGIGTNQIINPGTTGSKMINIAGTFGDSGAVAVAIVNDDQLAVSADVEPSLTFILSDNLVPLGTLSTTLATTATEQFQVGTNAANGYIVTINGQTLTHSNGTDTITEIGNTASVSATSSEQFGINLVANSSPAVGANPTGGSGTVASGFGTTNNFKYYAAGNPQTIASASSVTDLTTFTISFLANIAAQTEAGSYNTVLTLVATANF